MAVINNLLPGEIAVVDYELAQTPVWGAEREAFLSPHNSLLLGIATMSAVGVVSYEFINVPVAPDANMGPICAFVLGELKADTLAAVSFGGLTGAFIPVSYSPNQRYNFGAGRGIELIGGSAWSGSAATVPTITNAKLGSRIAFVQLPKYHTFEHVGSTTSRDVDIPGSQNKAIARGLEASRYVKKSMTKTGKLKITSHDTGADSGLRRFAGIRCVAMLETKSEHLLVDRQFFTNYVPALTNANPEGDTEATIECEGFIQHMVLLVAPGTSDS